MALLLQRDQLSSRRDAGTGAFKAFPGVLLQLTSATGWLIGTEQPQVFPAPAQMEEAARVTSLVVTEGPLGSWSGL